jgi:putative tryptophan/tyrosine transport system substrate-binding protein
VAHAQQGERMRRIGVLMPFGEDHPVAQARLAAFLQGLQQLSWIDGRNVRIDYRWSAGDPNRTRKSATELIALEPEVVMAFTSAAVAPVRQATSTVPIVSRSWPIRSAQAMSRASPGQAVTSRALPPKNYAVSGKWIELLKELVPHLRRVAVLRDSALAAGPGQFGALQALAPSFGIELRPLDVHDPVGIEQTKGRPTGPALPSLRSRPPTVPIRQDRGVAAAALRVVTLHSRVQSRHFSELLSV